MLGDAVDEFLRREAVIGVASIFLVARAAGDDAKIGVHRIKKLIARSGIRTMMPGLEKIDFREAVVFHEAMLGISLRVPREKEVPAPLGEKKAYGIIVLVGEIRTGIAAFQRSYFRRGVVIEERI